MRGYVLDQISLNLLTVKFWLMVHGVFDLFEMTGI